MIYISQIINNCTELCVPTYRGESLSSILNKICEKNSISFEETDSITYAVTDNTYYFSVSEEWVKSLFSATDGITYDPDNGIFSGNGSGGITCEEAQDCVGTILQDSSSVVFIYNDTSPFISASVPSTYVRGLFSAGSGITYDSLTGQISNANTFISGLSKSTNTVRLGQTVGEAGNPAAFTVNTEIPLGDYSLALNNKTGTGTSSSSFTFSTGNSTGSSKSTLNISAKDTARLQLAVDNTIGIADINILGQSLVDQGSIGYTVVGTGGYFFQDMRGSTTHSAVQIGGSDSQKWLTNGDTLIGMFGTKNTGFGGITSPQAHIHLNPSTASTIPLIIPAGVDPSSFWVEGSVWQGNDLHMYARLGGVKKQLDNDYNFTPDSFIQNQFLVDQVADYRITGHALIGDYLQMGAGARLVAGSSGASLHIKESITPAYGADLRLRSLRFFDDSIPNSSVLNSRVYSEDATTLTFAGTKIRFRTSNIDIDKQDTSIYVGGKDVYFQGTNIPTSNILSFYRSDTAAIGVESSIGFDAKDDDGTRKRYGRIRMVTSAVTAGSHSGDMYFETTNSGVASTKMRIGSSGKVYITTLDTDGTAPVTSGTERMVTCDGNGMLSFQTIPSGGGGGSSSLSAITAATATNSIDNLNYGQTWNWSTLNSTALKLSTASTAATSANQKILEISLSGANATSAGTYGAYITNAHTGGSTSTNFGIYSTSNGSPHTNVGARFETTSSTSSPLFNTALWLDASGAVNNRALFIGSGDIYASCGQARFNTAVTTGTGLSSSGIVHYSPLLTTGIGTYYFTDSITSGTMVEYEVQANNSATGSKALYVTRSFAHSNSGVTTYGAYITNTHTGTSSTNIASYFSASGGTTNTAAYFDSGSIIMNTLTNSSSQDRLVGQISSSKILGYITVGSGLSLSGGVLSATGGGGSDTNFAISDLTASGDRTHGWGGFDLTISNIAELSLAATTFASIDSPLVYLPSITNVSTQDRLVGQDSSDGSVGYITVGSGLDLTSGTLSVTAAGGTVTSFSAGTLSPLFTTSVATSTTTPALTFALSNASANTWFGNNTGSAASPAYNSAGTISSVNDTNITLALGGTPANSVLNSVSFTMGWTGTLAVSRGGTAISSYAVGDLLVASGTTTLSKLAVGTNGQLLRSNGTTLEYFTPSYISSAITSLGGLTTATQTFGTGTSGSDFNISSGGGVHTFNIPDASASARGLITTGSQTLEGYKTYNLGMVINETGADSDFRVESDGNANAIFVDASTNRVGLFTAAPAYPVDITGNTYIQSGSLGVGLAPSTAAGITLGGSAYTSAGLLLLPSVSGTAGTSPSILSIGGTLVEASSGTHAILAGLHATVPTIVSGAATVTNAATVYIANQTSATVTGANHALLVNAGRSTFGGDIYQTSASSYSTGGYYLLVRNQTSGRLEIVEPDVVSIDPQSGSSYTLTLADKGGMVTMTNAGANTLQIPNNTSVAFSIGTQILIHQEGAGQTTISGAAGVTLDSADGALKIRAQYGMATLIKKSTNTWAVFGDLTT